MGSSTTRYDNASGERSAISLERLDIQSKRTVVIDQFMLANDQFHQALKDGELKDVVKCFGGCLVDFGPGEFVVARDPYRMIILTYLESDKSAESDIEEVEQNKETFSCLGRVFIDTRCVVLIDAEKLLDQSLIGKFKELRKLQKEKEARDFLRKNGAAVRYGFSKFGDELGVFVSNSKSALALWPDVVDP